jgi:uncharacterized protein (TIGR02687 family)
MTSDQITTALERLYTENGYRIVFWNDPDREFSDFVGSMELAGVTLIRLDGESALKVKKELEFDDPSGCYLLYSEKEAPPQEEDWLLDIREYSYSFRADRPSLLIDELGLLNHSLRNHLLARRKFFENKERMQKLKALVQPNDVEADLDRKMIAVLLKSEQPELFSFLRVLFQHMSEEAELDLVMPSAAWEQIEKFGLAEFFWEQVRARFGYAEEKHTLKNLLIRLLATDFCLGLRATAPSAVQSLRLPDDGHSNVLVFLSQWRDSSSTGAAYDALSARVSILLKIAECLGAYDLEALEAVETFQDVEKRITSLLRDRVLEGQDTVKAQEIHRLAHRRMDGHWASATLPDTHATPRSGFRAVYEALEAAADFLELRRSHADGFGAQTAPDLWNAYGHELYRFDQLYRMFSEHADAAEAQTWSVLKPLRDQIELHYGNGFLANLALAWGDRVQDSLLADWRLPDVLNQQDFYRKRVQPVLDERPDRKVFVVISDAFRYEAARELLVELNGKYRFKASMENMLGVLPSYTALGMASLLPHQTLSYKANGEVLADGMTTSGLPARSAVLAKYEGMAVKAEDLMAMKRDEGREHIRGQRVIYVYHNVVDSTGDSAATEGNTFKAVRESITSLGQLTRQIIDKLNGSHVIITADHGFLFQETSPGLPEKSQLEDKPPGTAIAKKRYLLGLNLPTHSAVWKGATLDTARADGGMEFWVPKGTNRFHFVGGARFLHGGAMLQEIMVPLITVNEIVGKSKAKTKTREVGVIVAGQNHKITTSLYRFQFIQTETVSDRVKAITLKIAVYDGEEPVTGVAKETFKSTSDSMTERTRYVALTLQAKTFDSSKTYHLRLIDDETGIEKSRYAVTIDKSFHDDF